MVLEEIRFANFITRGFEKGDDDEKRIFKGHISAEIVDRQNEYIARDEILKKIDLYMKLTRGVSEAHSNRTVGQIDNYSKSEIQGHPSVYVEGHVFKQDGVTLYDQVWEKVKKGEYAGLSMGGASHDKEPIVKDGKLAMSLKNLEIYEIALCQTPANPLAIIDYVNQFAKDNGMEDKIKKTSDDRSYIQCNSIECVIEKTAYEQEFGKADMTAPSPLDSKALYKCENCGKEYAEQFDKCGSCGGSMKKGTNADLDLDNDNKNKGAYVLKLAIDDSDIKKLGEELHKAIWEQKDKDKINEERKELGDTKVDEIFEGIKVHDKDKENELIKELEIAILKTSLI